MRRCCAAGCCCAPSGSARTWGSNGSPTAPRRSRGMEADTEAALRRTRRLFVNRDNLRAAIRTVVNKTLEVRNVSLWGPGTACASDSRKWLWP
ncbi:MULTISPECIES: Tn3 family transposase [unclassified Nonomuraea]|uniref:Tn3 family transposase n=1 Tax=unclassified Nonomuraea TaxID=2593643 RepID=UPI003410EA7A